jgi:apolipoprotein N-acyltransferase
MKNTLKNPYLLAVLSGFLCILSFPPFDFSFLIWIALVPFLFAILNTPYIKKPGIACFQIPFIGIVFGIVFYFGTLHWLNSIFGLFGVLLLLFLCIYPMMFAFGLSYVYRKLKLSWIILLFPAILWTSIEYLKTEGLLLKFSWMNIGYSQHNFLLMLQFSSILGQYGLTALILLVNSFIVYLVLRWKNTRQILVTGGILFSIVLAILAFGIFKLNQDYTSKIKVALIQDESSEFNIYKNLINKLQTDVDFILLPEYAVPEFLEEDAVLLSEIRHITTSHSAYLIAGSEDRNKINSKSGYYNTAYLFNPGGEVSGKYYKMNPIQFFDDGDPGKKYSVFPTKHGNIGILICYDMDYSYVARNIVRNGAEMLFIPTYDAMRWSELEHLQHSAMTSMRAVENGRFIARTATSGISQIIDPTGRITKTIPIGISDVAIGTTMFIKENTFYTDYGYIFPYLTMLLSLVITVVAFFKKR